MREGGREGAYLKPEGEFSELRAVAWLHLRWDVLQETVTAVQPSREGRHGLLYDVDLQLQVK